jgi:hypothetical protein
MKYIFIHCICWSLTRFADRYQTEYVYYYPAPLALDFLFPVMPSRKQLSPLFTHQMKLACTVRRPFGRLILPATFPYPFAAHSS